MQVWLARCLPLDEEVALKIIEMDSMNCELVRGFLRAPLLLCNTPVQYSVKCSFPCTILSQVQFPHP